MMRSFYVLFWFWFFRFVCLLGGLGGLDFWYHRLVLLNAVSHSFTLIQVQALVPLLLFKFILIL